MILPTSIDHLVFRVASIKTTEVFYTALLGQPAFKNEGAVLFVVGGTRLFFTAVTTPATHPYDKDEVGLNHIALGVRTIEELQRVESQLNEGSVAHSGIKLWQDGLTKYIWLDDPDGMRVEYWLRLPEEPPL